MASDASPLSAVSAGPCPIGLLAGSGRFPWAFAEAARAQGLRVVCLGILGEADRGLAAICHRFYPVLITRVGRAIRLFRREGVRQAVMAGKVTKTAMFARWRWWRYLPDWRTIHLWYTYAKRDKKDDTLLLAVVREFARDRIVFVSALDFCPELLVKPGCLTRRKPTSKELADIRFGWELAKEMGRLDVGQTVAVKEKAVLAVEAIEGTDQAILRAGSLCASGNFTVVKVAKPQQDMRFDVPTIGTNTLESMRRARARVLAIEANKTIVLDQAELAATADSYGITIVALDAAEMAATACEAADERPAP